MHILMCNAYVYIYIKYIYISSYFKESFSGDYLMYHQFIPLHSWDYLNKISININEATDKGIRRNEI